ncbi:hypothetical protein [Stenotrophomonas sp. NPDC077659]|uniref:hypothetical protein n=1 Tax=Stenotrophomonas sp. NPDC077659 TaxID=3390694 RepID=UPI003D009600
MHPVEALEAMLASRKDSALLRFGLGNAWLAGGQPEAARAAWQRGLSAAGSKGDQQARREMLVFLRRLERAPKDSVPAALRNEAR